MVVIVRAPRTYASRSVIEATRTVVGLLNTVVTTSYVGPNITGVFGGMRSEYAYASGSFSVIREGRYFTGLDEINGSRIDFKASASTPIFGASTTVQTASMMTLICIKT